MDESTPKHTLDDLADLFLTGQPSPADPLDGPAPIKLPPKAARPASSSQDLRDLLGEPPEPAYDEPVDIDKGLADLDQLAEMLHADLNELDQPAPVPPTADAFDGPALRLTDDEADEESADHRPAAVVEAVVLGNLPGMAGPWLTQYGQLLAQKDGAVVVLHIEPDAIDLELIEPTAVEKRQPDPIDPRRSRSTLRVPPGGFADRDLIDVLDQLCGARVSPVQTVLLHLDATAESLPRLVQVKDWTLLSGADDAAIVAGYRLLKQLLEADQRVAGRHVGLMIAGSDRQTSRHAAQKLRSAVGNFLHAPLELLGFQQRMIPARSRALGRFEKVDELWPRLMQWIAQLETPAPRVQPETAQARPAAKKVSAGLPPLAEPVRVDATPKPAPAPEPATSFTATFEPDQAPDLFELIDSDPRTTASIPGGIALEARCPRQPHTQLALDAAGRLHLLHRHDSADGDPPTPREAIVELVAVRDWARQHRQLLQLTERGRRFDPDADPVLHLFTDRADLSVDLVGRLGNLLKLHLLRDVQVGGEHTFFCVPLSA